MKQQRLILLTMALGLAMNLLATPRLKVSENKRFLVKADGSPFFYLGDTAWELFHRLNREEADRYLKNRADKGFTVIQAVAADVRRPLYWNLFTGAFGHTYGHHSVWQMWQPGRKPINNPLMSWAAALDQPGAAQMQHGRRLTESRPFLTRVPDDSIIVTADPASSVPGAGAKRYVATRDAAGSYAMVYVPAGRAFKVKMDKITGGKVKAWWFNPRNGKATVIGTFANSGERQFLPPEAGENLDWVLVLDDAAQNFAPPGKVKK